MNLRRARFLVMSTPEPSSFDSSAEPETRAETKDASREPSPSPSAAWAAAFGKLAWPAAFVTVCAMGFGFLKPAPSVDVPKANAIVVEAPTETVIKEIRGLGRLETAAVHVEKVVDVTETQKHLFGLLEAKDSLLYVASGELVLGVDLTKLRDGDTRFDPATKKAFVTLPEPELFSSRLDEVRSHVHVRNTEILAQKNDALESVARGRALAAFEVAAHEPSTIAMARARAEQQLRHLAKAWGASDLEITWRDAATAEHAGP